jgi:pimeloyl-ACP methyl ester carboxylesterase
MRRATEAHRRFEAHGVRGRLVLLGFSYGGFVVTGALEHIAERVRHLVYLDAFVLDDGDTADGRRPPRHLHRVCKAFARPWRDLGLSNPEGGRDE